ncbi:MAG: hypothetical protein JXB36_09915 [Gammaproteobacteria bacterium]|nr:hypothetical protein [Gammaproteobacteria bacterium]
MPRVSVPVAVLAVCGPLCAAAWAHHGFGRFDLSTEIELEGTLTGVDFVNPHAYLYFDAPAADGGVMPMRCEMRAATVLRRSGWSEEMFLTGAHVSIVGRPHRDDPASCYIETLTIGDAPTVERYEQFTEAAPDTRAERPLRLPSGEPNIAGDWAQEQYLLASPPEGRGGLVPKSMVEAVESGEIAMAEVPEAGWGARPVTLTEAGQAAADAVREAPIEDHPRMRCEITSILFDWVFDGPINRITQSENEITLEYGRGLTRTIRLDLEEHPAGIEPSRAGHSIGRWENGTLVVDTVGFLPGILAGDVPHSGQLHVVERFTLETEPLALKRDYVAEDPVYFTDRYVGSDTVKPADAPFAVDPCEELTYRNYSREGRE